MDEHDAITLTRRLSEAMAGRGLGVPELAGAVGVAPDDVRSVLAGHLRFVEERVLQRIQTWLTDEPAPASGRRRGSPARPRRSDLGPVPSASPTS